MWGSASCSNVYANPTVPCPALDLGRFITLDLNSRFPVPLLRQVIGELHPHQLVHLGTKSLLDPQRHFRGKVSALIEQQGNSLARNAKDLGCRRNGQAKGFNNLPANKASGM